MILYSHSIWRQLELALKKHKEKELIIDYKNRSLTGKDILNYINNIAIDLNKSGIEVDDRVLF